MGEVKDIMNLFRVESDLLKLLAGFLLLVTGSFVQVGVEGAYAEPKAVDLMNQLKKEPISNHGPIYTEILNDTSVLEHPGLRQQIILTAKDDWYGRYIEGNVASEVPRLDFGAEPVEFGEINEIGLYEGIQAIVNKMESSDFTKGSLWLLPGAPSSGFGSPTFKMRKKLSRQGPKAIKVWLSRVEYGAVGAQVEPNKSGLNDNSSRQSQSEKSSGQFSKADYRLLSAGDELMWPVYELVRRNQQELNKGTMNRLERFSWRALSDTAYIPGIKKASIAFLLDRGIPLSKIEKRLVVRDFRTHPDESGEPSNTIPGSFLKKQAIDQAEVWRDNFPLGWSNEAKKEIYENLQDDLS